MREDVSLSRMRMIITSMLVQSRLSRGFGDLCWGSMRLMIRSSMVVSFEPVREGVGICEMAG